MAGIQERGGSYRILFRYHCKRHTLTLGKVSEHEAKSKFAQVGGSCRGSPPRGEVGDRYGVPGTPPEVRRTRRSVWCPWNLSLTCLWNQNGDRYGVPGTQDGDRHGVLGTELTPGRIGTRQLDRHEWWLPDLARALQMSVDKLRIWAIRGWVRSRQVPPRGLWAVWADGRERRRPRKLTADLRSSKSAEQTSS
jgi:hypothetical protein